MKLTEVQKTPWELAVIAIKKECSEYLSQTKLPCYRGMEVNGTSLVHQMHPDRKPLNTDPKIHTEIDKIFTSEYNWPFRSKAMFASGNEIVAAGYTTKQGSLTIVIPINGFKFLWSPIYEDLWALTMMIDSNDAEFKDELVDQVNHGRYTTKYLDAAVQSNNEIMFACHRGFIAIDYNSIFHMGGNVIPPNLTSDQKREFGGESRHLDIMGQMTTLNNAWNDIIN